MRRRSASEAHSRPIAVLNRETCPQHAQQIALADDSAAQGYAVVNDRVYPTERANSLTPLV